jgi:hypothetical protein
VISGIVDLHVHSAPSLVPRHTADPETAASARAAGVATMVLKAHEGSTAERAQLLGGGAVGGVVLNSPVGGANPDAVAIAARLGARIVWLPTISSTAHRAAHERPELRAHAGVSFREVPVVADGRLVPAWIDVFDEVAAADMVLASGHLTMDETALVFAAARRRGVGRLLVNHPLLDFLGWRDEHVDVLRRLDAHLEVGVLADILAAGGPATEQLAASYPAELLAFGSDLGHADYPPLAAGLAGWVARVGRTIGDARLERIMTTCGQELLKP